LKGIFEVRKTVTRKDLFKQIIKDYKSHPRGERIGRMANWIEGTPTCYGYNMISIKPGNDFDEFYRALEQIKHKEIA
jgi:hypothetical protein